MTIIIHKPTGELMNEVEFRDSANGPDSPYRHILFDISHEGFEGSDFAIVEMQDQPVFDSRYQKAIPVNVVENDGAYSGEWELVTELTIPEIAALKANEITIACESAITAGFWSSALGDPHFYSCDMPAQLNIQANLLAASVGRDVRHICTNQDGVRDIRDHSAAQMIAVGDSMGEHIWAQLEKVNGLRVDLESAVASGDAESIIAIRW